MRDSGSGMQRDGTTVLWDLYSLHISGIYIVGGHPINTALKFKPVGWCAPISSYLHGSVHAPKSSYPGIGSVHASKIKDLALGITKILHATE